MLLFYQSYRADIFVQYDRMMPPCPVCANSETAYFHKRNYYSYFRCSECKLIFLHPVPSVRKIASLYDKHYEFRVDRKAEDRFIAQSHIILGKFRAMSPATARLLDIGAGYGTFIQEAKKYGFHATGLEPANNLFIRAKKNGANVVHADFETYFERHPNVTFDAITMIHVIEHLRSPERQLRLITRHLKKNGVLFIETPNADSHLLYVEQQDYTFLTPPEHIHLFAPASLESLVRGLGHEVSIQFSTYSYPEHFMGIVRRIRHGQFDGRGRPTKHAPAAPRPRTARAVQAPYLDTAIAPRLTPLLNVGHRGSILQMYVKLS